MTSKRTKLDGNWRICWHDLRRRHMVYVIVLDGQIIDIQPELTVWLDRPFTEFCRSMRQRYPKTFEREEFGEQLVTPTDTDEPNDTDEPMEHRPVRRQVVTTWPGVQTIVLTADNSNPLALSQAVVKECETIQREWTAKDERERRLGSSIHQPYELHGTSDLPRMPRGHRGFVDVDDCEDESPLIEDQSE